MELHWTLLLSKDDRIGSVDAQLLAETLDGLDTYEVCRESFGPFDTAKDVTDWLLRHWAPRAKLPLR